VAAPRLIIRIDRGRVFAEADDAGAPADTDSSTVSRDLPSEPLSRKTIAAFIAWLDDKTPRLRAADDFQLLGWHLWEFLFRGEIAEAFAAQLSAARLAKTPLRLELRIEPTEPPEIANVPWEFLFYPARGGKPGYFVGTHSALTLLRTNASTAIRQDIRIAEPPRIQIVTSCPPGFERVVWRPVVESIASAIAARLAPPPASEGARPAAVAEIRVAHDLAAKADLRDALAWRPHILHFIGHGEQDGELGKLAILRDAPVWLSGTELAEVMDLVEPGGYRPRLIVLHACEGARIATAASLAPRHGFGAVAPTLLAAGVPAVIAMQYEIDQASAIDFSVKLYLDLLANRAIPQAVQAARQNLMTLCSERPRVFGTPVLYMSGTDGVLFAPPASAEPSRPPLAARSAAELAAPASLPPASAGQTAPFSAAGITERRGGG
jgi:hypothetical protein